MCANKKHKTCKPNCHKMANGSPKNGQTGWQPCHGAHTPVHKQCWCLCSLALGIGGPFFMVSQLAWCPPGSSLLAWCLGWHFHGLLCGATKVWPLLLGTSTSTAMSSWCTVEKCPLAGWVWAHMLGEVQCHWWTWPVECQWSVPLVKVAIAMAPCFMAISLAHSLWGPCGKLVWTWAAKGCQHSMLLVLPNLKWVESKNVVG